MITNQDAFNKFPGLLELMLKFLENKRWESQNTLKKKFGSLLTPMISSVQNIQTTLINAPDNVLGMVKGVSELVLLGNESSNNNNNHKSSSSPTSSTAPSAMSTMNNSSSSLVSSTSSADIQRTRYQSLQSHSTIVVPSGVLNSSTPKSQSVSGGGPTEGKELIDRTVLNDDDMVSYF